MSAGLIKTILCLLCLVTLHWHPVLTKARVPQDCLSLHGFRADLSRFVNKVGQRFIGLSHCLEVLVLSCFIMGYMKVLPKLGAARMALVKSSGCSSRGPGFGSLLSHGRSQPPAAPKLGHLTPYLSSTGTVYTQLTLHSCSKIFKNKSKVNKYV